MLSIENPNMHSAQPTARKAMVKLSMTALPEPHASASGMNTTATTPSGEVGRFDGHATHLVRDTILP
ncbi:hypothetical protein, partial [Streptomyces sp. NPDC096934]|uniref:hypothetical protein n=1 Tax=Streptomyces sp. NPDC096934 TaxID=3155551 RepID=UPI003322CCD0